MICSDHFADPWLLNISGLNFKWEIQDDKWFHCDGWHKRESPEAVWNETRDSFVKAADAADFVKSVDCCLKVQLRSKDHELQEESLLPKWKMTLSLWESASLQCFEEDCYVHFNYMWQYHFKMLPKFHANPLKWNWMAAVLIQCWRSQRIWISSQFKT